MAGAATASMPAIAAPAGKAKFRWLGLALFLLLLVLRIPFANEALHRNVLSPDEIDLALGAADRYLGVPLANTHWPASTNQMLLVPLIAFDYLANSGFRMEPKGFLRYLSAQYRQPWHLVWQSRMIVVILSSLGFAYLGVVLSRNAQSILVAACGILLAATVPELWKSCFMSLGNGTGIAFLCLATGLLLNRWNFANAVFFQAILAGACTGLALSSRNTLLVYLPFLVALLWMDRRGAAWLTIALFLISTASFALLTNPGLWIEPVRWGKATLGNYVKSDVPTGLFEALRRGAHSMPLWFLISSSGAWVLLVYRRKYAITLGAALCAALILVFAARAAQVEPRYFAAATLALAVILVLGAAEARLLLLELRRGSRPVIAGAALLMTIALALNCRGLMQLTYVTPAGDEMDWAEQQLRSMQAREVMAPLETFPYLVHLASRQSLEELRARCEATLWNGESLSAHLSYYGLPPDVRRAVSLDFNEKEEIFAARLRLLTTFAEDGPINFEWFASDADRIRFNLRRAPEIMPRLERNDYDAMVALGNDALRPPPDIARKGNVYVLNREQIAAEIRATQ